jgi:Tfp pilus assembly protein PilF
MHPVFHHIRAVLLCSLLIAVPGCSAGFANRLPGLPWRGRATTSNALLAGPLSRAQVVKACIVTAEQLEQQGHDREAALLYEKARAQDPGAIDYSRRLAVLYDREQEFSKAMTEYRLALQTAPRNPDVLNDFGYFHFRQGNLNGAEDLLRRAVTIDDNHEQARTNLGVVLAHQGRYEESFQVFAGVVGVAAAHANLGAILAKQGEVDRAKWHLNQALTMNPALKPQKALLAYLEEQTQTSESIAPASYGAKLPDQT